jgi:hypothetical protein
MHATSALRSPGRLDAIDIRSPHVGVMLPTLELS